MKRKTECGVIDRAFIAHAKLNHKLHSMVFDRFEGKSADLVACVFYTVFCIFFIFAVAGWQLAPFIPAQFMFWYDVVFGLYGVSTILTFLTDSTRLR